MIRKKVLGIFMNDVGCVANDFRAKQTTKSSINALNSLRLNSELLSISLNTMPTRKFPIIALVSENI